MAGSVHSLH